jgi:parvulin-like peptidyl-prolyl isomerase
MDALVRRLALVAALAAGAGCGTLDRRAHEPAAVERGQAPPDRPLPPVSLPPQATPAPAPVVPVSTPPAAPEPPPRAVDSPAPIAPLTGPVGPVAPITTVSAHSSALEAASTRVKVMATVGADAIITDEEVGLLMKQRALDYIELKGDERVRKEREVYRDCLRALVERELLLAEFLGKVKKNKPGVLPELWEQAGRMADDQLRAMRAAYRGPKKLDTEAEFATVLDQQGMPYKVFRRQVERAAMVNLFLGTMLRERNGTPTLAQVQDYYARHADEFKTDDRVKYLDLFVSFGRFASEAEAKRYADDLFQQARTGADFVELIKTRGHGDSPLRDGVGIGTKRGDIQPAALEATVFDVKPGNISGVIPTETGYHIVKVVERQVAGVRPFDEKLQSDIRNKLMDLTAKAEREKLVTELWRKIGVTIVEK